LNAKERFIRALNQQVVDQPPMAAVVTGITVEMMEKTGVFWPAAHSDAHQLAMLAASVWEVAGIECIKLPFCMTIEVETFGAPMDYGTMDTLPTEIGHVYNHPDELVIPEDFFERDRVPIVLEAIRLLRDRYADDVAIVSSIVGPFALAAKLFGFDNLFPWLITNPDYVHQILEELSDLAIRYATAQVEAGADAILIGEATCSGDLISGPNYRDFIAPHHKRICEAIPAPTILHICGDSTGHLPYIADTGATAYSFDEGCDIHQAREHLKGKVALAGYVPTVEFLLQGTSDSVYQASLECLGKGVDILAPGCSLPQHTKLANIEAMRRAVDDYTESEAVREVVPHVIEDLLAAKNVPLDQASLDAASAARERRARRKREG